jgi:hypothetical protein
MKTDSPPRVGVAVLARAPIPGQAKTRLIPALGAAGAARLQGWLLQRAVAMALVADVGPVTLWCAGDPRHPDFALCRAFGSVAVRHQPAGDLGARMRMALRESATEAGTLIVGTDCPAMTTAHLRRAARSLCERDAVVLPAEDGGYVLIGLRRAAADVFDGIDWGTERVMAQTRERLRALGCGWDEPATLWDVDRPPDLERLLAMAPELRDILAGREENEMHHSRRTAAGGKP